MAFLLVVGGSLHHFLDYNLVIAHDNNLVIVHQLPR